MRRAPRAMKLSWLVGVVGLGLPACIDLHPPSRSGDDQGAATGDEDDEADADDADGDDAETDAIDADDDTDGAPLEGCGWGPTGDENVPYGYACGGEGEDPAGTFGLTCPRGTVAEAPCGEITGVGCCLGDTLIYCTGIGEDGTLYALECGPSAP